MHYHNRQLDNKTFDQILRSMPERKLELPGYRRIMTQARMTKVMPRVFIRNYVVAAAERTDTDTAMLYDEPLILIRALRAYMVGTTSPLDNMRSEDHMVVVGNVTIPAGVQMHECVAKSPFNPEVLVAAFECHTVDVDSYVALDTHFRCAYQRGGMIPPGHERAIYLGPQVAPPKTSFTVFIDQGSALAYAGIKRATTVKEKHALPR